MFSTRESRVILPLSSLQKRACDSRCVPSTVASTYTGWAVPNEGSSYAADSWSSIASSCSATRAIVTTVRNRRRRRRTNSADRSDCISTATANNRSWRIPTIKIFLLFFIFLFDVCETISKLNKVISFNPSLFNYVNKFRKIYVLA